MEEKKQTVLTLKFIGIDDFSCPTYEDQYGRFWKDLNLGKSETRTCILLRGMTWMGSQYPTSSRNIPLSQNRSEDPRMSSSI